MKNSGFFNIKIFCIFLFTACSAILCGATADIEKFFSENAANLWTLNPQQVNIVLGVPLKAQDEFDNIMRYNIKESKDRIIFKDMNVAEVLFYFHKRKLQSIMISFYNRGDSGNINEKKFQQIHKQTVSFLTTVLKCKKISSENIKFDKSVVQSVKFADNFNDYILLYSNKSKTPEYVQLKIYHKGKSAKLKQNIRAATDIKSLKKNLQKANGNLLYLDIPMVNQGRKGYCAAATIERIMKYYGAEVDQQIIAQIAKSDAEKGTNAEKLFKALEKNSAKLNVKIEKIMTEKIFNDVDNFKKFHETYNNFAKKQKLKRIKFKDIVSDKNKKNAVNISMFMKEYFYDVFLAARMNDDKTFSQFKHSVRNTIQEGIPLVWISFVLDKDKSGEKIGNAVLHMNIINGCKGTDTLVFTDSWGKNHSRKIMNMRDAWARTSMLIKIMPK